MVLDTNMSSVFRLRYILVLVSKVGDCLVDKACADKLKEKSLEISKGFGIDIKEFTITKESVVFEFAAKPNTEISKFVNAYKSATSRKIKKEYPELAGKSTFWTKGYLLLTIGNRDLNIIEEYIANSK